MGTGMKAMLLAAGEGRRMRPLTLETPKPLLKAGGKPLIVHHLEKLAAAGFRDVVINHAHLGQGIEDALGDGRRWGVRITYSPEDKPLETAGGIIKALPLLGGRPFLVVNADIWTDYSFRNIPDLSGMERLAHLVLVENPPHHPGGDYGLTGPGYVSMPGSFHGEVPMTGASHDETAAPAAGRTFTFSGIAVYHPDFFAGYQPAVLPLKPFLDRTIGKRRVSGEVFRGRWMDVGTPDRLRELDVMLRNAIVR